MFYDSEAPLLFDPSKEVVAVFIDFENMRLTVEETGAEPFQMHKVLDYVNENIGRVAIKKAYSNWHYVNPLMYNLLGNNIDMIQVYPRGTQRKNAADIRLTADAMETLFMYPHIDTYVIVASDSDYTGLIIKLREHGKKVAGIGTRQHTSEHLVQACNLFRFYRTIAADDPESLRSDMAEIDFQQAKDLLVRAMMRHRFVDRPAIGRWLRWQMIQLEPSFDEQDYGFATFREFLEACNDVIKVTEEGPYRELKIELRPGAKETLDESEAEPGANTDPDKPYPPAGVAMPGNAEDDDSQESSDLFGQMGAAPISFPQDEEDITRTDYLRTLWTPRIYLYNRNISVPVIREIFQVNGPGKALSEYELEEHLLGPFTDQLAANGDMLRYELNQKMVYAIQKLMFWAGTLEFLENDELNYWKKRKRAIPDQYSSEQALFEQIDFHLARHFAYYLPLVPDVLVSIFQGGDTVEYATKIVDRVKQVRAAEEEQTDE